MTRPRIGTPVKHGTAHYWDVIRAKRGRFTYQDLQAQSEGVSISAVRNAVTKFVSIGLVAPVGEARYGSRRKLFVCTDRKAKTPVFTAPTSTGILGRRQLQMWRAMRTLPRWTIVELAAAASTDDVVVKPALANGYVVRLVKAGIVMPLTPKRGGRHGCSPGVYRLRPSANTGPKAPEVYRNRGVFDPNRKAWVQTFAQDADPISSGVAA